MHEFWVMGGQDSVVGIATGYGLDGSQTESRWERPVQIGPGVHLASSTMDTELFLAVKRRGSDVNHPFPFSAEVKERVEAYSPLTCLPDMLQGEL